MQKIKLTYQFGAILSPVFEFEISRARAVTSYTYVTPGKKKNNKKNGRETFTSNVPLLSPVSPYLNPHPHPFKIA